MHTTSRLAAALLLLSLFSAPAPAGEDPDLRRAGGNDFRAGKYGDAIADARAALDKNPRDPDLHLLIGKSYARTDNFDKAIEHLEQANALRPAHEETCRELGDAYLEFAARVRSKNASDPAGREFLAKADAAGRALLKLPPKDKESYWFLTELALRKAKASHEAKQLDKEQDLFEEAIGYCEKVLAIDPNSLAIHLTRIRILMDQKRLKEAEKRCLEVLQINPKLHSPKITLARIKRISNDPDGAIQILTEVINEKKSQVEALLFRAEIYLDKQMYEEALTDANEVLRLTNKNAQANFIRGQIYLQYKKLDDAITEFQQAAAQMPKHAPTHFWLTRCYVMKDKFHLAIEELDAVLKLDPRYAPANLLKARALLEVQQAYRSGTIAALEDARQSDPRNTEILRLLGMAYVYEGEYDRAQQVFRRLEELQPSLPAPYQLLMAMALSRGQADDAIGYGLKALEANTNNVDTRLLLGRAYQGKDRLDDAQAQFEKVIELRGRHSGARMALARIQEQRGKLDLAEKQLLICIDEDPALAEPRYELARVYGLLRQFDKAQAVIDQLSKFVADKAKLQKAVDDLQRQRAEPPKAPAR